MKKVINTNSAKARLAREYTPWGEIYARMRSCGWDQIDLAKVLDVSEATVSNLLNGRTTITVQLAETLSLVFGETAEYWILKQLEYFNKHDARLENTEALRIKSLLYKLFPIRDLFQIGWISSDSDVQIIETELSALLGIHAYQTIRNGSYRKDNIMYRNYIDKGTIIELLWVSKAKSILPNNMSATYSKDKLKSILDRINTYSHDEDGVSHLLKDLNEAGVAFKILSSLPKLSLNGGLLWDKENPAFVYTLRNKSITAFKAFINTMIIACLLYVDIPTSLPNDESIEFDDSQRSKDDLLTALKIRIHSAEIAINGGYYFVYEEDRLNQLHLVPNYDILLSFATTERMYRITKEDILAESGVIEFPDHCYYLGVNK